MDDDWRCANRAGLQVVVRGNTITAVFGGVLGGKPRPAVVLQDDRFDGPITVLAIPFTSGIATASIVRPVINPDSGNGLEEPSCPMTDKMFPVRRKMIGKTIGRISDPDMERIEFALQLILGMAKTNKESAGRG